MRLAFAAPVLLAVVGAQQPTLLVTGATGRLGAELYSQAKALGAFAEVRGLVTNLTEARLYLNCTACDASEGIFVGDVTNVSTLAPAMAGADAVAIAVGASGGAPADVQRAVEFDGVENQVRALYDAPGGTAPSDRQLVLCSSMGTTDPSPSPMEGGSVLFWKLNAEAQLLASDLRAVVVKPCGLTTDAGGERELVAGHDDELLSLMPPTVPRADVARVMLASIVRRDAKLRFDLCSTAGEPTTDLDKLLESARYPQSPSEL